MAAVKPARPTPEARIKAALWFADHGFSVFTVWSADEAGVCRCPLGVACTSPGKHPVTAHGFQDATRDPDRIRTLLSAGSSPNYGLVCPEGVFALDVDADDDGIARLTRLEATFGALPPTLRTRTAHGEHVFLRWPDDHPRPIKKMFGYVTRWGSGRQAGYVIGPRSVHPSGVEYEPVSGTLEIATLPERWAAAAIAGESAPTVTVGGELPERGGRHDWLRNRARHYRGFMNDPAVLRAALLAENSRLPDPKTEAEVDRAIGRVFEQFPPDPPEEVEEKIAGRLGEETLDLLPPEPGMEFPGTPSIAAFGGVLGACVEDLAEGTDASMVGLLGSLLTFCGAMIPGQAYFHRIQTTSPFVALVGESSVGRKGTAMMRAADAMADAVEQVHVNRVMLDGLASGEGLVTALHYKQTNFPNELTVGLVFEEEYATLLAARSREGSTLDPKMRAAFDGGVLSNRRSGEVKTVTPPYWLPALIAITPDELRQRLEAGAMQSGSANRWLYLPVTRREIVPTNAAPRFSDEHRVALVNARRMALGAPRLLDVDPAVVRTLAEYTDFMSSTSHGLARDLTRRLGVIAFRVALVHAVVERADRVTLEYLDRALALTEYARRGIPWVFGHVTGNKDSDLLLRHLIARGRLTKRVITREIIRDPLRQQQAIDDLQRWHYATVSTVHETRGRPRSELVSSIGGGVFRTFVHGLSKPDAWNKVEQTGTELEQRVAPGDMSINPGFGDASQPEARFVGTNGINGQKTVDAWTEVGINVDESPAEGEWASPCHFYDEHRSQHYLAPDGWRCSICSGPTQ